MSTLYNRRRGAKAKQPRKPRQCAGRTLHIDGNGEGARCIRLATRNKFCDLHQADAK